MTTGRFPLCIVAMLASAAWAAPTRAADDPAVAQELAAMRVQMAAMKARIETLEAQAAAAGDRPAPEEAPVTPPASSVVVQSGAKPPAETAIAWKGAPELTTESGWSFKPRGRLQVDAGTISSPKGIVDRSAGFGSEVRRAYLGFDGKIPGGFGYRAEIDVAASNVEITDLYLTYQANRQLGFTIGQHKPFWGLEELTSDLFTSMTERAAMNTAFGFERRLGISASYAVGDLLAQGGVFTDNVADLNDDENDSLSLDGRLVFAPRLAAGQLHIGGSAHWHELDGSASNVRYRVRPFIHTPDIRFIDTGNIVARSEMGYGLEGAYIRGPFHTTGEAHWQHVNRPGTLADPSFFGGYAEVGMFLTPGDTRGYKGGAFDRVRPKNPVSKGGPGAVQVNLRYDRLDLVDAGIVGGRQNGYDLSLIWTPIDYVRFVLNYGHVAYTDAAIPAAGGDRDYAIDAIGMRAQVDF